MKSHRIVLTSSPIELPVKDNFRFESIDLGDMQDDEVLLRSRYISIDPFSRIAPVYGYSDY